MQSPKNAQKSQTSPPRIPNTVIIEKTFSQIASDDITMSSSEDDDDDGNNESGDKPVSMSSTNEASSSNDILSITDADADHAENPDGPLPVIKSLYDCDMIRTFTDNDGKRCWECLWCNQSFKGINHTKVVYHLGKKRGGDIRVCSYRFFPIPYRKRYHPFIQRLVSLQHSKRKKARLHDSQSSTENERKPPPNTELSNHRSLTSPSTNTQKSTSSTIVSNRSAYIQTKIGDRPNPEAEGVLSCAIADMIHSLGLAFSFASESKFRNVLRLAKSAPTTYTPPSRNSVAGPLLDDNYEKYKTELLHQLSIEVETFGLTFYGDGATVRKMPLFNILAAGVHCPAAVLEIADCSSQMQSGGKKDAKFISDLFLPHMRQVDPLKSNIDLIYFDGASNVQKAGRILANHYPRITSLHAAEHVVSLFFSDISKIPELNKLIKVRKTVIK